MSTTIDERVVEMRFDNKQFETNVATSMSTLEKLKKSLNLSGASKGLENVSAATKRVDMSGLGGAVDSVKAKFSALQVVGVTALANITNSAINTGKSIVKSLTIDPVKSGLNEYETKMGSIQTILANTEHQGTTLDDVTAALDRLNLYADKTIYNFQEMTRNIGTFTAAGVDLETSVRSIQGIANLAAISGSTSQQASVAMYQLSQALATGTVKLQDWNSVVNAGMGGKVFQNALIQTAAVLDGAADDVAAWQAKNIDAFGSFRESLSRGEWLTSEVLTRTLEQFTMAAEEGSETWEEYKKSLMDTGYTEAQAESILKMANTASDAATKVKTFTQLRDTLKESAQSGWGQSWEIIIGNFEEAKAVFTELSDLLGGFIGKTADQRNNFLSEVFTSNWDKLISRINEAGIETEQFEESIRKVAGDDNLDDLIEKYGSLGEAVRSGALDTKYLKEALKEIGKTGEEVGEQITKGLSVDLSDIFTGKYGETTLAWGSDSVESIKKVQTALTELGFELPKYGINGIFEDETRQAVIDFQKSVGLAGTGIVDQATVDALIKAGDAIERVGETSEKTGNSIEKTEVNIDDLVDSIGKLSGRELLFNTIRNSLEAIIKIVETFREAWGEIFTTDRMASGLYNFLDALHSVSEKLIISDNVANKLKSTFKGVIAIFDILTSIVGGVLKAGFDILSSVLDTFGFDVLNITRNIGDVIVAFRDWLAENDLITKMFEKAVDAICKWFDAFKQTDGVQKLVTAVKDLIDAVKKLLSGELDSSEFATELGKNLGKALASLPDIAVQIAKDFIAGFQNGISDSVSGVISGIIEFCVNFVTAFASALGVHSPSVIAYEDGTNFIQGFIDGLKAMIGSVVSVLKKIGGVIVKVFKSLWDSITDENGNIEWGKLFAAGIMISAAWFLKQIATAFSGIANAFGGIDDLIAGVNKVLTSFSKVLNSVAWDIKAQAIKKMAIAVAILAATVLVLSQVKDVGKLWNAVGVVAALAAILVGLAFALQLMSKSSATFDLASKKIDISGLKDSLLQIALAILLVAASVKLLGGIDDTTATKGFERLAVIAVGMLAFVTILGAVSKHSGDVSGIGRMMLKLSAAMILMVGVCKLASKLSIGEMLKGAAFAAGFVVFVKSLVKALSMGNDKQLAKVGGLLLSISLSMTLMVGVCKLASKLSIGEMLKGAAFAAGFVVFVKFLVKALTVGKDSQLAKVAGLILSVSFSLTLMVGVCKLVSMLSLEEVLAGAAFVAGFVFLLKCLVKVLAIGDKQKIANVASTLLAMSVAIAIMAAVAVALSSIPLGGIAKGIIAVGLLSGMMILMVKSLKGAQNAKGAIMMMAIAIGIMAAAVVALSFIDTGKVISNALAMSTMMVAFAFMIKCLKGLKTSQAIKGALGLLALMVPLVAFVGILYLLDGVEDSTEKIISLTAAMAAFTIMAVVLSAVGHVGSSALKGVGALLLLMVPLYTFVKILCMLDGVEGLKDKIMSLVAAMAAMTLLLAALAVIGAFGPAAIIGVGSLLAMLLAIGGLAVGIGAAMDAGVEIDKFLNNGLPILERLATGIGTMMGNFVSGFGTAISEGFVTMSENLSTCMDELTKACDKAKNIDGSAFNGVGTLLDVIGDIALTTVGTSLSDIFTLGGTSMEKFQKDGVAFFESMKAIGTASAGVTINEESMDSIIVMAGKLVELQSSIEPIGGVIDFFKGRDDLGTFGASVAPFISSMQEVMGALSGVTFNEEAMGQIISAATGLTELQSSIEPIGGVIDFFKGRDDLGTFGASVAPFISSMQEVMGALSGVTFNEEAMGQIISAATGLSTLQSSLEPMGGVIDWFKGRSDLGTFGTKIGEFATAMGTLKTNLGEDGISDSVVTSVTNAGNAINALQQALPTTSWFDGKMDLTEFSTYVTNFGNAMSGFSEAGTNVDDYAISTTISAAYRIKHLIADLSDLSTDGLKDFIGGFGSDGAAVNIAQCMSKFSKEVSDIDVPAVATSVTAATRLKALVNTLADLDTSGIENFKPINIGEELKSYSNTVAGLNTSAIDRSITAANKIKALISSLSGFNTGGVDSFKSAVNNLSTVNLSGISDMMTEYSSKMQTSGTTLANSLNSGMQSGLTVINNTLSSVLTKAVSSIRSKASAFIYAGRILSTNLASGISSGRGSAVSSASSVASSATTEVNSQYGAFRTAGHYLVAGFCKGINESTWMAKAKAKAMAKAAVEAAEAELGVASPSKVFKQIGAYSAEGFAIGLSMLGNEVEESASSMASIAVNTARNTMSTVLDTLNTEVDSQPTIRPIVDLSDVKTGADAIHGMFNGVQTVGVRSNLNAINASINSKLQNGSNDDVVSAINKLNDGLANVKGDTYTFGNFTYDDGSNISDTIKTLIRYAKIGGRV